MQLKHSMLALAAAGMLSAQAYASEAQVEAANQPAQAVAAFTEADMAALFDNANQPMQIAALSPQEMQETEGAAWWIPVWYAAVRFSPYIPSVGVWALNQSPRIGNAINSFRNR